jgi:hypothetical protein
VNDADLDAAIAKMDSLEKQGTTNLPRTSKVEPDEYAGYAEMREQQRNAMFKLGEAKAETDDALEGANLLERRLAIMTPGLREVYRMYKDIDRFIAHPTNLIGVFGLLQLTLLLYSMVSDYMRKTEEDRLAYQELVMKEKGYTLKSEFDSFIEDGRRKDDAYRNRAIVP